MTSGDTMPGAGSSTVVHVVEADAPWVCSTDSTCAPSASRLLIASLHMRALLVSMSSHHSVRSHSRKGPLLSSFVWLTGCDGAGAQPRRSDHMLSLAPPAAMVVQVIPVGFVSEPARCICNPQELTRRTQLLMLPAMQLHPDMRLHVALVLLLMAPAHALSCANILKCI